MNLFNSIVIVLLLFFVELSSSFQFRLQTQLLTRTNSALREQTKVISDVSYVDFRVGKVVDVKPHDIVNKTVWVTKVDVGEPTPRTMCAGVAKWLTADQLLNKLVVACCNLKPRNIEGVMSSGMILVAKDEKFVNWALLEPPEGSVIGEQIQIEGVIKDPLEPGNRATKAMDKVNDHFVVNEENIACYQKQRWSTSAGFVKCPVQGAIS